MCKRKVDSSKLSKPQWVGGVKRRSLTWGSTACATHVYISFIQDSGPDRYSEFSEYLSLLQTDMLTCRACRRFKGNAGVLFLSPRWVLPPRAACAQPGHSIRLLRFKIRTYLIWYNAIFCWFGCPTLRQEVPVNLLCSVLAWPHHLWPSWTASKFTTTVPTDSVRVIYDLATQPTPPPRNPFHCPARKRSVRQRAKIIFPQSQTVPVGPGLMKYDWGDQPELRADTRGRALVKNSVAVWYISASVDLLSASCDWSAPSLSAVVASDSTCFFYFTRSACVWASRVTRDHISLWNVPRLAHGRWPWNKLNYNPGPGKKVLR